MKQGSKRAFTLIEALVAIVLIGIAVTGLSGALASMTNSYRRTVERDLLQQLANQKLDEIVGTGEWATVSSGEFVGDRYENMTWETETETTSIEGLEYLRITVTKSGPGGEDSESAETLVYRTTTTTIPLEGAQ